MPECFAQQWPERTVRIVVPYGVRAKSHHLRAYKMKLSFCRAWRGNHRDQQATENVARHAPQRGPEFRLMQLRAAGEQRSAADHHHQGSQHYQAATPTRTSSK
jgi:hypothetical protein